MVQGITRSDRELLDAQALVGELVEPGSIFAFLAEHRHELFPDSFISDLFASRTGRPSLPADLIGSVLVLKELYDLSDPQTAEALRYDIRWKVACGRSLSQTSFDPSTLVYWRKRIAASDHPDRVFDAVAQIIAETAILRGRRKRCVDSTVFDDAVATQDTVTQLVAAMRKVARLVPGAQGVISRVAKLDYSKPGKPSIDWDDPVAKQGLVSDLVNDALAVLGELAGPDAPERADTAADALGLLALVAGQDVEPAEDSDGTDGRWRIARRVAPDRVISTVDTEARHTRKSKSNRKDGFRGHLVAEPETELITDAELTKAAGEAGSDAVVGQKLIARDRYHRAGNDSNGESGVAEPEPGVAGADHGAAQPDSAAPVDAGASGHAAATTGVAAAVGAAVAVTVAVAAVLTVAAPVIEGGGDSARGADLEVYGDTAYGTGAARAAYQRDGHDMVIKPKPLVPAVPGGFTLDDFTIDEQAATVTCPGGHTRTMTAKRSVTFGAVCAECPLRSRCTTAKDGRSMSIHPHEQLLRAARAQARTPEFKQAYPTRSMVERIVAWTATSRGRRIKLRYLGVEKNHAWLRRRCAAINLRTLVNSGLTRTDGAWALA
ncbi:transposase, IS4 family protein (plasmid) [Mycobacterium intracellulare subsp. chimaera]|uniref:Transposase, IS4 family protein n=3 Tax=Mycobacterium intracellulare TaxID=1767 RepID=A0A7U5MKP9_MYCIT|nr:transposase [Mycobacterium intracellulare]ASL14293.1 transposase, IS4 family protein [Mycobacterium intracellulare subsp. chimaera]ASL14461.1 transposase, IS4 family protein [Mycobacterium intracellulare subsp. chimaera]ASL14677.1 transposase, IS4 family protein [Mycobacterium intracellulare subsp. chimaera]ASL15329.1 transposase, IS4 family protein [Mycobacterium intracellulare subsp. chimaera]ASL15338.1 transposase, IS4 family protein [Mycobacterium intracellulare subsp. chimaera]